MSAIQAKVIDLRQRAVRGEEISDEELREAVQHIRVGRAAAQLSVTAKKQAKTPLSNEQVLDLFK
ncbi:hypothetical protein [Microcystis phage Mel-JY34]|jgi:hypothetical protein